MGLVTSEALVLGCDSVASTSSYFLDPISLPWVTDETGQHLKDADGKFTLKFAYSDYQSVVTNAWGGVTKMFEIHPSPSPVVAITAGLAKLNDRPMASYANEFLGDCSSRNPKLVSIETICRQFLKFMRREYDRHYKGSAWPVQLRDGPEFLVGGFGRDDAFPSLFRLNVQNNTLSQEYGPGKARAGVSWNGQADALERFIRGYDRAVRAHVQMQSLTRLKTHAEDSQKYVTDLVNRILDALKQPMPAGIDIALPELKDLGLDWDRFAVPIDYANLPLQEAVSFVSAMVMVQASRARFAHGVATVGGRTHIGVVTKQNGFRLLNEPELAHRYTGFSDDL
jgi:hypothetical protein